MLRAYGNRDEDDRNAVSEGWGIEHVALNVALDGDLRAGARLAGYTRAVFDRVGCRRQYTEQTTRARLDSLPREGLAPAECEALLVTGAALSRDGAIALALASLGDEIRPNGCVSRTRS